MPQMLPWQRTAIAPNGLCLTPLKVPRGHQGAATVSFDVPAGTPSLVAAVLAPGWTHRVARLSVLDPNGDECSRRTGNGVAVAAEAGTVHAITVVDPAEGVWECHLEATTPPTTDLHAAAVTAPYDEPTMALQAALPPSGAVPAFAIASVPSGAVPFLIPAAVALRPLAGTPLDIDNGHHAVPIVAASDLTGAHPDAIAEALSDMHRGADVLDIVAVLGRTARL